MENKYYPSLLVGLNILLSALIIGTTPKAVIANAEIHTQTEKPEQEIKTVSQKLESAEATQEIIVNQQSTANNQQPTINS